MKKTIIILLILVGIVCLAKFGIDRVKYLNLTDIEDIKKVYLDNEDLFIAAAQNEDFLSLKKIKGIQDVYIGEEYVGLDCGGAGLGSSTHYYGIFYSEEDNICAVDVAGPYDEMAEDGKGYKYIQKDGDNRYYVEPLGNHYFYYEAHF